MTRRLALTASGAAALFIAVAAAYYQTQAEDKPTVLTSPVARGDVVETVEATGTLQAVTTVQVGTQVSGTIKTLRVDFNSRSNAGRSSPSSTPRSSKPRFNRRAHR